MKIFDSGGTKQIAINPCANSNHQSFSVAAFFSAAYNVQSNTNAKLTCES